MPIISNDHTLLKGLDWASSGHTGFGSAVQGAKADTALQIETDPAYIAEKALLLLKLELPNFSDFAQKTYVKNNIDIIEAILPGLLYGEAPQDDYIYIRRNNNWIKYGTAKTYQFFSDNNFGIGFDQMIEYSIPINP